MTIRILVLFCFLFGAKSILSQKGQLRIRVKPRSAIIHLDSISVPNLSLHTLDPGEYFVQAWSLGKKLHSEKITVKPDEIATYRVELKPSKSYKFYVWQMRQYKISKNTPLLVGQIGNAGLIYFGLQSIRHRQDALEYEELSHSILPLYESATSHNAIHNLKTLLSNAKFQYELSRKRYYTNAGLAVGVFAASKFLRIKLKKNHKSKAEPEFDKTPLLVFNSLTPISYTNGDMGFALKLDLR